MWVCEEDTINLFYHAQNLDTRGMDFTVNDTYIAYLTVSNKIYYITLNNIFNAVNIHIIS